jgi:hypothetical protein
MGKFQLPLAHRPAMAVPKGGSSCSTCRYYHPQGGYFGQCGEPNFKRFYGTTMIPCPADEFCSDWYEPAAGFFVRSC